MGNIKAVDMLFLDDLFEMRDGYVLDFSNHTMAQSFADELDIDIYSPTYAKDGTSIKIPEASEWNLHGANLTAFEDRNRCDRESRNCASFFSFLRPLPVIQHLLIRRAELALRQQL